MNVACRVHPLAALAFTGPLASASGLLIASFFTSVAIWLRLLGIRAREAAESPFRGRLLPRLAAAAMPFPRPQTRSLARPRVDQAPMLLRALPPPPPPESQGSTVRPPCARAESLATVRHAGGLDTPPPPVRRNSPVFPRLPETDARPHCAVRLPGLRAD